MLTAWRTVRAARPTVVDAVIAAALTAFATVVTLGVSHWHPTGRPLDAPGIAWLIAGGVPLLWRTRFPVTAFVASAGLVFGYYASSYPGGPSIVLPSVALITVAILRGPLVAGIAGGALVVVETSGGLMAPRAGFVVSNWLLPFALWITVAVTIGSLVRLHRAAQRSVRERRAEAARLRAEEQRLCIAREVHDVVAHSLAMINVQAGVAAHVADRRPEQAKAALLAIKEVSRSALVDLRATLDVLRSGDDRAPTPGLDRLPDLVAAASATGLTVRTEGSPGSLPAPVDVAAYRIVQESLTNVVRHGAGADTVAISLARTADELEITVLDNGAAGVGNGSGVPAGNGLRGMAERAAALGGTAEAGPTGDGGFRVHARLPLTGDRR